MRKLLGCVLWCLMAASARAESITLVADVWCPYNCALDAEQPGFMVELAKAAFAKHNIAVEYSTMAWTKAIDETRRGKYTGIIGASRRDASDFVFPALTQGWMQNHFYVRKGTPWRYHGLDSLAQVTLGVAHDYSYSDELDEYIGTHLGDAKRVIAASGDAPLRLNLERLVTEEIGALVEDERVMSYYLRQNKPAVALEEVGFLPTSEQNKLYIAFSPKNPKAAEYAKILGDETKAMRESGELKAILERYGLRDWELGGR